MDKHDIRIPSIGADENGRKGPRKLEKHDPFHTENSIRLCSLRDYLSILYLKPRMQIILRQKKPSNIGNGVGVIGVVECNFLNPAHNKQDFEYSKEFRLTMINLGLKLNEYWKDKKCTKKQVMQDSTGDHEVTRDVPDQTWVQCDDCLNWRKLPEGIHHDSLPDKWYCSMNQDRRYRSCDIPEEPESSDEEYAPSYEKKSKRQRHKRLDSERSISPCWDTPKKQKTTLKMETKEENCKKPKKEDASSEDDTDYEKNDEILEVGRGL